MYKWTWCDNYMEWQLISTVTGTVIDYISDEDISEMRFE